jgi:hypothetical protein
LGGDPGEDRVANIGRAVDSAVVTGEPVVGDVHLAEPDELFGGGLDSAPALSDPVAVAKDKCGNNGVGDGTPSRVGVEVLNLECNALGEELFAPDCAEVLPPGIRSGPGFAAPTLDYFVTMIIVMKQRYYGHSYSSGVAFISLTAIHLDVDNKYAGGCARVV